MGVSGLFRRTWSANSIWVTDLASGTTPRGISAMALDSDGDRLAAADYSGRIYILSASNGKLLNNFGLPANESGWTPAATAIAWSPEGQYLAVGDDYHGHLHLFHTTGEPADRKRVQSNVVSTILFTAKGKVLVTGGDDGRVRFWKMPTLEPAGRLHVGESAHFDIAQSNRVMATVRKAGGPTPARVIELRNLAEDGRSMEVLDGHADLINCMNFSNDGRLLASGSGHWDGQQNKDCSVAVWKTDSDELVFRGETHDLGVTATLFAMDDSALVTTGHDGKIIVWTLALNGKQESVLQRLSPVQCAAYTERTQVLVVGYKDGNVEGLTLVRSTGGDETEAEQEQTEEEESAEGDDIRSGPIVTGVRRSITARLAKKRKELPKVFNNSLGMWLQIIEPGEFMMGSPEAIGLNDEHPQHKVVITKRFYMSSFPITQAQYKKVTNKSPSGFKGRDNPVETVSWEEAVAFCEKLSKMERRTYRLPTEAEWEYCCRAGEQGRYCCGDSVRLLSDYCWYGKNSMGTTYPVGKKEPNKWGLYDTHGNVWEWCSDYYGETYYSESPEEDPQGPAEGQMRVVRGGAYDVQNAAICRSAGRLAERPETRVDSIGFRVIFELRK